jgi:hypothetical protein
MAWFWKLPLPEFIEELYIKHFKKRRPDNVRSIEQMASDYNRKKEERRASWAPEMRAERMRHINSIEGLLSLI